MLKQNDLVSGSLKQTSSSKLKNIYSNNAMQNNNISINNIENGSNPTYQKKMMLKNSNQIRNSYNPLNHPSEMTAIENARNSQ